MCSPGVVSEIAEPSSFSLFGTSGEMINFWNFRLKGSHYSLLFLFLSCFKQLCPVRKRGHKASPQQGEERRRTVAEPFKPLICSSAVLLIKKAPWKTHLHNTCLLGGWAHLKQIISTISIFWVRSDDQSEQTESVRRSGGRPKAGFSWIRKHIPLILSIPTF